jgi:hypothetical protein
MQPTFLVPETEQRADGESAPIELGDSRGRSLSLTLGITRIVEQESLDVSVVGSVDGENWEAEPLVSFPQKFYCGTYTILLDLSKNPDVKHVKVAWKMSRWGRGEPKPLFGFYVFAEKAAGITATAGA